MIYYFQLFNVIKNSVLYNYLVKLDSLIFNLTKSKTKIHIR